MITRLRIAVVGSGLMGAKLGTIFARSGHQVTFSYARTHDKLASLAGDVGAHFDSPAAAVANSDVVLLAVRWNRLDQVLSEIRELDGKIVVSCMLPMNGDDSKLTIGQTTSGIEQLAKRIPRAHVVAAFNTVPHDVLMHVFDQRDQRPLPSMIYYGDDPRAKTVAETLIVDAGFDPIDAGQLLIGRFAEPFALLMAQLAYETGRPPVVAYKFSWLE
ncbi:MAG TPA: NAD(P)-binding domain-containing protein [Candidatus Aquilonibacter sp.]|nr:NAD(P)-binding domain-containing protein [Candidatus Aquilonibacter sp.]